MEDKKILIVEDELKVAQFIKKGLETQSFKTELTHLGKEAVGIMSVENDIDLVILDIGLPDLNGLEVCRKIRETNVSVPILMLTAYGSVADKISGFEVGTDDYLVKPFDFMELLVRVKALLKRVNSTETQEEILQVGDLQLDLKEKVAIRGGNRIELTAKEYGLLEYLLRNRGRVVSKVDIAEKVWDINFDTGTNFVEVYINYLRKKVDKGYDTKLIHTIIGMGYMLKVK